MKILLYAIVAVQSSIALLVTLLPLLDRMRGKHGRLAFTAD
jgi:hypothetical protein